MESTFVSLLCIVGVAFLAPLISWLVPRRLLPEVVLLTIGGMLIGEHALGLATETASIAFLHELGLAFLFLMAGYEIDVNELRGVGGHHAMWAWVLSLVTAFGAVALIAPKGGPFSTNGIAIAIAMTSTAIGTLLPIMRERGLLPTSVGAAILNHGAVGEVGPIILMALLLGSRSTWASLLILVLFGAVTLLIVRFTDRVKQFGHRLVEAIHLGGSTTAQTTVRLTVLLLVGLCTLAEVFDLDVVLGAFAAGFVVRQALPDGNKEYEEKIEGLAYGLFIPLFFVTSGMGIAVELTQRSLIGLGLFLLLLVLARGLPVWLASRLERRRDGSRAFTNRQCLEIATYSTTALPIIVAVTQVAVTAGVMVKEAASTFVLAGLLSVIVMPALGLLFSETRANEGERVGAKGPALAGVEATTSEFESLSTAQGGELGTGGRGADGLGAGRAGDRRPGAGGPDAGGGAAPAGLDQLARHGLSPEEARILAERLAQIQVERAMWRDQFGTRLRPERRGRGGRRLRRR
ncbi:glutathione-regulated potassium-efflux system protein KefC [Actinomyces bovis]|uniref:Glutathione-regulated potassium-efflux system protein KefC n=1 Tax=Actinomyces bovis TaxID=1658 RepID=A0ABY1VS82_9ACTO|nr:cation:proton antiporter [Actinomyces bovis]SPT55063.1 glutathione-regulated potassium-efflux system protein KefC [Actinomyces bovis]VEG56240.1 glutathione-regulated potassium-efflux system protein KefC [Actinomyces israelii]